MKKPERAKTKSGITAIALTEPCLLGIFFVTSLLIAFSGRLLNY
jgi:hypothetical protein